MKLSDRDRELIDALADHDDAGHGLAVAIRDLYDKHWMTQHEGKRLLSLASRGLTILVEIHDVPTGEEIHA